MLRRLGDCGEDSADHTMLVANGAVGVGEVGLLQIAEALHRQVLVVGERGLAGFEHAQQLSTDDVPVLGPHPDAGPAERGMLVRPEDRDPRVVVDQGEFATPPDRHRVTGAEADADRGPQALRPLRHRPQRRGRPVERGHPGGHLAFAREGRNGAGVWRLGHRPVSYHGRRPSAAETNPVSRQR